MAAADARKHSKTIRFLRHMTQRPAGPIPSTSLLSLNPESDEYLQNIITLGGTAMGKSAMMPPYGRMLSTGQIRSVIAFARAIAEPAYHPPARAGSQYSAK